MTQGALTQAALIKSPAPLIDIGVNLVDSSFAKDRQEVLERAREANVQCMIVTGTCVGTSRRAQEIVDESTSYPLYFTAGVHPHHAKECNEHTLGELRKLLEHPKCVAVGETGLDFNRNFSPPDVQEVWFDKQVALAVELKKPLFMHCRDAGAKFAEILGRYAPLPAPAVIHCFTGTKEELASFVELGLHIGITGWICDERPERGGAELASLLPSIPKDRLMIETDAPYLVPRTIKPNKARPGRNEPALLPHVLQMAAQSLGEEPAAVAQRTTETACRVFGITL
uniref:TatD related DNase n=1 Tax=Chlamydomonas leiostraca TaxID=1034604 RepID=A0A7S0S5G7_9CHLO